MGRLPERLRNPMKTHLGALCMLDELSPTEPMVWECTGLTPVFVAGMVDIGASGESQE